ncbi:MAG: IS1595 family transposase [Solirubrobacterales bacterium]
MAKADRNNPKRSKAAESDYTLIEFMRDFPDDRTCLHWLWMQRFSPDGEHAHCPKCEVERKFHRTASRPSYSCDHCGHHIHPTAETIFHKSSTSLQLWIYAIYLVTSTRCGISAKQLEREIGVGYKTAWRMLNKIRTELMGDDYSDPLSGEVEMDETLVGGKPRKGEIKTKRDIPKWVAGKASVFAAVERDGRAMAKVVPNSKGASLKKAIGDGIDPDAAIFTDQYRAYMKIAAEYGSHDRVNHKQREYVRGNVHTNTVEGFFGNLKNSLQGTHHGVSEKWLQSYLDEHTWRYNNREGIESMFGKLLNRTAQ